MEKRTGRRVCRMKHWITCMTVVCVSLLGTANQILAGEKQQDTMQVQTVQTVPDDADPYQVAIEQELGQPVLAGQEHFNVNVGAPAQERQEIRSGVMLLALTLTGSACIGLGMVLVFRNRKYRSQ